MAVASARLISKKVSQSKKLPKLSPDGLNLYLLMIPHYSSHGKMNGDPNYIKGGVVPRFDRFNILKIKKLLKEISDKTNVKWFEFDGLMYLHSLNFAGHQPGLRKDRMGEDTLPSYVPVNKEENIQVQSEAGLSPDLLPPEVEVEVEVEVEAQDKIIAYLNKILGTKYKSTTKGTMRLIKARMKEGYKFKDFKKVIDVKTEEWKDDSKMSKYLTPDTLFSSKFEKYFNQSYKGKRHEDNRTEVQKVEHAFEQAKKNPHQLGETEIELWKNYHKVHPGMGWDKLLKKKGVKL